MKNPLYIIKTKDGIYFSSEIKGLMSLTNLPLSVNENHIIRFLANGYRSLYKTKETFFHEVENLSPSSFLKVNSKGTCHSYQYWSPCIKEEKKFLLMMLYH